MFQKLRTIVPSVLVCGFSALPGQAASQTLAKNVLQKPQQEVVAPAKLSLDQALDILSKKHKVLFEFNDNLIKNKTIDRSELEVKEDLENKLKRLLSPLELRFERFQSKSYLILDKNTNRPDNKAKASIQNKLTTDLPASHAFAGRSVAEVAAYQQAKLAVARVEGKVSDENGEGLPGVNVVVKGSQTGTSTDIEGRYSIEASAGAVLVFSYVGFLSQEVTLGNNSVQDIVLKADNKTLEEVVVVGYGTVKRKDLTGSIGSLDAKEIKDLGVARVDQALLGKVAGVQVLPVSGAPGADPQIRIRGIGSISAGSQPLYVVDGFPTDNIQTINPSDIESMDILKDASATAIYGSRGANGVIIINTKRGKAGKSVISFDAHYGLQKISKQPEFMDARQQAQYYYDGVRNRNLDVGNNITGAPGSWGVPVPQTVLDVLEGRNTNNTNALDAVLRTASQQQYQLSATGGTENVRYAVSTEYMNQDGIIKNSNFSRYSLRANVDAQLTKKLSAKVNMNAALADRQIVAPSGWGGGANESIVAQATSAQPYYPLYNPDGSYFVYANLDASTNLNNPVALANEIQSRGRLARFLGNINLEYAFTDELKLNVMLGGNFNSNKASKFTPQLPVFFNTPAVGVDSTSMVVNWITETTLNYNKSFGDHSLSALVGYTTQKERYESNFLTSNNYPNNLVPTLGAVSGIITNGSSAVAEWSLLSYLSRINYNYKGKYYVTASVRTDGSSRFGADKKYGLFPSAALAWRLSDEAFLKDVQFLSEFKARASYGATGNNNIGNYEHYATINYHKYNLGGVAVGGYAPAKPFNPGLTWEKQQSINFGVDLAFFNRRIMLTVDRFQSRNTDLLLNVNVPAITGFNTMLQNVGEVKNRGWEFVLNTVNVEKAFQWSTDFNLSTYKNEVVKLGPSGDPIISARNITMIGQPIGMFYGLRTDGIFKNQAELDAGPIYNPGAPDRSRVGDQRFVDVSGPDGVPDGIINSYDYTIIGSPYPDFYYGMTNRFAYKNFSLSVSMQGSYGNEITSTANDIRLTTRSRSRTLSTQVNYWKSEQDPGDGMTPRPNDAPTGGVRLVSPRYMDSGSYLRINNINFGYLFPEKVANAVKLSALRVYVNVTNPFIFTKNTSFNPDVSNTTSALTPGIDYNNYPLPKSLIFGVNVTF
ncbi:SusC/RagA family TonB-linked outer membrane protein [Dyadobacter luteus]|jgi:TonB-linked SusC/RagA family outer membrane protein|uniref:SusC/RagA family TonB-linked outer membrane protein n=1 Tax=Dyadobacter luteus TaxID=2259619 RepID=A0A3D8YIU7_9BACT|nr:TonB-dependent receptor [Dyadobacter luteus]REA63680.1 SusC/RagA family TonB-linked outer membrane protein [Dyadobacter luteus]